MSLLGWYHRPNGRMVKIIVRDETILRLAKTCFRGKDVQRAGNFSRWDSVQEMLSEKEVLFELLREVDHLYLEGNRKLSSSVEINCLANVGWSSTERLELFDKKDLEVFNPNWRSQAMRVKPERHDLLAPLTTLATFVFEMKMEGSAIAIVIHSIYPGRDVGEIDGDITAEEGEVFFDWTHPGVSA